MAGLAYIPLGIFFYGMNLVVSLLGALASPLARWAASSSFVWEGKTFHADSDTRGVGHNRVRLQSVLGRQNLFPFETSFGIERDRVAILAEDGYMVVVFLDELTTVPPTTLPSTTLPPVTLPQLPPLTLPGL